MSKDKILIGCAVALLAGWAVNNLVNGIGAFTTPGSGNWFKSTS